MKNFSKTRKFGIAIISILSTFGLTAIVAHLACFGFSFLSLFNCFFVVVVTGILDIIFYFSTSGNGIKSNAKYNYYVEPEEKLTVKKFFGGLGILIACGIGYIPLFLLGGNMFSKINSSSYEKAEATIVRISTDGDMTSRLGYAYEIDGETYYSSSDASWGGISFKEGKKVIVYYNVNNPEITLNLSNAVMFMVGGGFFLLGGLIFFFIGFGIKGIEQTLVGFTFMFFAGGLMLGMKLASGFSFFELIASGASAYTCLLFSLIGLFIFISGIVVLISSIKTKVKFARYSIKAEIKKEQQLISKEQKSNEKANEVKVKPKYKYKFEKSLIPIILCGLVFLVSGIGLMIGLGFVPIAKAANNIKVTATVTEVHTYYDDGSLHAQFDYEYYYDGVRYEGKSSYSQSADIAPSVGDTIKITISKNNPAKVLDDSHFMIYIAIIVGLIVAAPGGGIIIYTILQMRYEVKDKKSITQTATQKNINKGRKKV